MDLVLSVAIPTAAAFAGAVLGAYLKSFFSETGRIDAVTLAITDVVHQETSKAFAQEQGKQQAVIANLDSLHAQVKIVTTAQEEIKTKLSDEVWHRQWRQQHLLQMYAETLQDLDDLILRLAEVAGFWCRPEYLHTEFHTLVELVNHVEDERRPEITEKFFGALEKVRPAEKKIRERAAFAEIFGGQRLREAFRTYSAAMAAGDFNQRSWGNDQMALVSTLRFTLINVAREDLRVDVAVQRP